LIQVDIGGHPPIPWAQKIIFHLGSFLTVCWVPNFRGHFEALNNIFRGLGAQVTTKGTTWASQKSFFSVRDFQWCIKHPK
jgi:hypothetical protein